MKKKIIIAAISLVMLVGCNEVPEDVRSRTEEREEAKSAARAEASDSSGELGYISLSDLRNDIDKALSVKYSNFILADGLKVDLPAEYSICDFKQADDFEKKADILAGRFFTEDELEGETISLLNEPATDGENDPNMIYARGFRDNDKKLHCFVWDSGFSLLMKPYFFDDLGTDSTFFKLYHVDRGDDLSDKYKLADGEMTVKEASDLAQEWVDKNYSDIEPDYLFRVKTVIVRMNDDEEYHFLIRVSKIYKGIALDELCETVDCSESDPNGGYYYRIENSLNYIEIKIGKQGEIGYFSNATGTLVPKEKGQLDKIISLSSALGYLQKTFADFNDPMKVGDIELKYMLSPEYDYKAYKFYNTAGTKMKGRIVWEFVIDVPQDVGSEYNDVRKYICIDVQTGEMIYEFDVNALLQ